MGNILSYMFNIGGDKPLANSPPSYIDQVIDEKEEEIREMEKKAAEEAALNNTGEPEEEEVEEEISEHDNASEVANKTDIIQRIKDEMSKLQKQTNQEYIQETNEIILDYYLSICKTALEYMSSQLDDGVLKTRLYDASKSETLTVEDWTTLLKLYLDAKSVSIDETIAQFFDQLDETVTAQISSFKTKASSVCINMISEYKDKNNNWMDDIEEQGTEELIIDLSALDKISDDVLKQITELEEMNACLDKCVVHEEMIGLDCINILSKCEDVLLATEDVKTVLDECMEQYDNIYKDNVAKLQAIENIKINKTCLDGLKTEANGTKTILKSRIEELDQVIDTTDVIKTYNETLKVSEMDYYVNIPLDKDKLNSYMNGENNINALVSKYETYRSSTQTSYRTILTGIEALITDINNADPSKDPCGLVSTYESLIERFNANGTNYDTCHNSFTQASNDIVSVLSICGEFSDEAKKILDQLKEKYIKEINDDITNVNKLMNDIKNAYDGFSVDPEKRERVMDNYHKKNYTERLQVSIDTLGETMENFILEFRDYFNDKEGTIYSEFLDWNEEWKKLIRDVTLIKTETAYANKITADSYNLDYTNALQNLNKEIGDFNKTLNNVCCRMDNEDKITDITTDVTNYQQSIAGYVTDLNTIIEGNNTLKSKLSAKKYAINAMRETLKKSAGGTDILSDSADQSELYKSLVNLSKKDGDLYTKIKNCLQLVDANKANLKVWLIDFDSKYNIYNLNINSNITNCEELKDCTECKKKLQITDCETGEIKEEEFIDVYSCISSMQLLNEKNNANDDYDTNKSNVETLVDDVSYINYQKEIRLQFAIAYDIALSIDKTTFQPYLDAQVGELESIYNEFHDILSTYITSSNEYINRSKVSMSIVNSFYNSIAPIYDTSFTPRSVNADDLDNNSVNGVIINQSPSIIDIYNSCMSRINSIKDIYGNTTDRLAEANNINNDLTNKWKTINKKISSSQDIFDDLYTQKTAIEGVLSDFEDKCRNINKSKDALSEDVLSLMNIVETQFDLAESTLKTISDDETNLSVYASMPEIAEYYDILSCLNTCTIEQVSFINTHITNVLKYSRAAKIISYLYCAAWIGFNNPGLIKKDLSEIEDPEYKPEDNNEEVEYKITPDVVFNNFRKNLVHEKLSDTDVFEILCKFTPILPLIWPIDASFFAIDESNNISLNKTNLIEYIKSDDKETSLSAYLTRALVNSNDCSVDNFAVINAKNKLMTESGSLSAEEFAMKVNDSINNYCEDYVSKATECETDYDFIKLTWKTMIHDNTGHSYSFHLWHKILKYVSGRSKTYQTADVNLIGFPSIYPIINSDYESSEASLLMMNRFFSFLGKLRKLGTVSNGELEPVSDSEWKKNIGKGDISALAKLSDKYTLGGMCFAANNTKLMEDIYHYNETNLINDWNIDDVLVRKAVCTSILTTTNGCAYTKDINSNGCCSNTETILIGSNEYVKFINPSNITSFLFRTKTNGFGFEDASAFNFKNSSSFKPFDQITKVTTFIKSTFPSGFTSKAEFMWSNSIELMFNETADYSYYVFKYIYDAVMNWSIRLPIIPYDNENMDVPETNYMYPISKINTLTYTDSLICFYDMFK